MYPVYISCIYIYMYLIYLVYCIYLPYMKNFYSEFDFIYKTVGVQVYVVDADFMLCIKRIKSDAHQYT